MGRGKLPLKLIEKERARRITCMKRKSGLLKKAYELSTLCDVPVCLIIHDPGSGDGSDIKTWPESPEQVERIIADYLSFKAKNPSARRDLTTADFFNDRIKKLRQQNERLVKRDRDRDGRIEELSTEELLGLLAHLDAKIDGVRRLKAERAASAAMIIDQASSSNRERAIVVPEGDAFLSAQFRQATPFDRTRVVSYPYYTNLLEGGGVGYAPEYWYGPEVAVPGGDLMGDYGQYQNFAAAPEQLYLPGPMMNFGGEEEDVKKVFYDGGFGKAHEHGHGHGVWF